MYFTDRRTNASASASNAPVENAGLPIMACIMWGNMGIQYQAEVRQELDGDRGHVISTSIPYMVLTDRKRLRHQLRDMRRSDIQQALPNVDIPPVNPQGGVNVGNCAEHPTMAMYVPSHFVGLSPLNAES